jgi:capsular polysaccharide biosynthesis protein
MLESSVDFNDSTMSMFSLTRANKGLLILSGLSGMALAFLLLVFFSRDFTVQTDYLVIQQSADKQDFYTLSKSVEYSGNILKAAIASDLFFSEAANTNYFDVSAFPSDERERLKLWRKSIKVSQKSCAGILEVTVKRPSQTEAKGIARAIASVLIEKNELFRSGTKDSLSIKVISGPIVEQNPTVKTLAFGLAAGAVLGTSLMLLYLSSRLSKERARMRLSYGSQTGVAQETGWPIDNLTEG